MFSQPSRAFPKLNRLKKALEILSRTHLCINVLGAKMFDFLSLIVEFSDLHISVKGVAKWTLRIPS
jgi:hypothetical protein